MTKTKEADWDLVALLNLIDMCRDMHVLPLSGGLLDQDCLFVDLYEYVFQLRATRQDMDERQQQANARTAAARRQH